MSIELFTDISRKIKSSINKDRFIIAPVTEFLNRYCLHNRNELQELGYVIPLVDIELYEAVSDKKTFGNMCRNFGITVPEEISLPEYFSEPFVAKPIKYTAKNGKIYSPVLVQTEHEFYRFLECFPVRDFYYQKFITGESIYILFYFSENGKVFRCSQRNLMQQDNGKSIIAAEINDFYRTSYADKIEDMFRSINFSGLVMTEIRKYGDTCFMIEANPRFWGPSQLFVDAGYNFFNAMLNDWGFDVRLPDIDTLNMNAKYFWEGGITEDIMDGRCSVYFDGFGEILERHKSEWEEVEIYRRSDTLKIWEAENLHDK